MKVEELPLAGAYVLVGEALADERGYFARTFDAVELENLGLDGAVSQCSISQNRRRGTLRGMHFQRGEYAETKVVRCLRGRLVDVVVDLRRGSPTCRRWAAVELAEDDLRAVYVPKGFAHGFVTLSDDTIVGYQISVPYQPGAGAGIRWDDPALDISWPMAPEVISDRDATYPAFSDELLWDG